MQNKLRLEIGSVNLNIKEILEKSKLNKENLYYDEPMAKHTSFKIGGPADVFIKVDNIEELKETLDLSKKNQIPLTIIGNGSNILVKDEGYRGAIIKPNFNSIEIKENIVEVGAGVKNGMLAQKLLQNKLAGFEFASGIPGTIGGACVMNAGAYGGEMKDVLESVTVLTGEGKIIELGRNELELGYRTSVIAKKGYIVLGAVLKLERGDGEKIKTYMDELKEKRVTKQPLEYPSAGSTFKRPEGYFAGKLIEDAGLRGFQVGGAQVSEKHCGFVINRDHADIMELMRQVQIRVKENSGVDLEPEVKRLGDE